MRAFRNLWSWLLNLIVPADSKTCSWSSGRLLITVRPAVKSNGGFENHEDIEPGLPDLTDGFSDALGLGKGFVDRVSQFLHQDLQIVVHLCAFLPWACLRPGSLFYEMHFNCHQFQYELVYPPLLRQLV